ncbi:hypothetical protein SAMN04487958_104126 [Vreelandella subterranea]|uniref:Uncharacterized protein n=1 Tax=Vreelandella subterranea TaxID=416874 RepID=A0A1H9T0A5_9GAMM|nr:DUF4297 family anti-phage-associated protein [Halomonas subterranea]SER90578.1 hypothetical protein SAMN04487958_104126 [Halomonas subterranea]
MSNRSAHATIKGYFYQFDHTIVSILNASAPQSRVIVEGIEDIDLDDGDYSALVQCKYYEGTTYNHSVIKDAVIQMLRHYSTAGCPTDQNFRYRVYGHYKEGQGKLPADFDLEFLKKNFLTYNHERVVHEEHTELGVNDTQLENFRSQLDIDIHAPSYDDQQSNVIRLLVSQIPGCNAEDAKVFYYPNAINVIQSLAIQSDINSRKITKSRFVKEVNRKEVVFSLWLQEKFGNDYYAKLIKKKFFKHTSTKIPKASRIFIIDINGELRISDFTTLLVKIGNTFSHVEHTRTPQSDRFCPYILIRGNSEDDLVSLKTNLFRQGVNFNDGYPFKGAEFYPDYLVTEPSKENKIRLKFIPEVDQLAPVISEIRGSVIEIFDFYKDHPVDLKYLPTGESYNTIKVNSAYFIDEVLRS